MISIQLEKGSLDVYLDSEIDLSWTGFRFQEEIRDAFTNDITIPKTQRNIEILSASGLLDATAQMFGDKTVHAALTIDSEMVPVYLQVVAIRKDEIDICLYEDTLPDQFKDKYIQDYVTDNSSTIYRWNQETYANYPMQFPNYSYGIPFTPEAAERHPIRTINSVLSDLSTASGVGLPTMDAHYAFLATKKKVCPQNQIQVIEFNDTEKGDNGIFMLHGSQHVVNDLSMTNIEKITFNRSATINLSTWLIYSKQHSDVLTLWLKKNGTPICCFSFTAGANQHGCMNQTQSFSVDNGDYIEFSSTSSFVYLSAVIKMEYSDYTITEEDYDIDLNYVGRLPRARWKDYTVGDFGTDVFVTFNGDTYTYNDITINTEALSFAYYGYYCNLEKIPIGEILHSLQWIEGKKLKITNSGDLVWASAEESAEVQGVITELRPISSYLGQNNYIRFKDDEVSPLTTINNSWLEVDHDIHQSAFSGGINHAVPWGLLTVKQYSDLTIDDDGNKTATFNDIGNIVVCYFNSGDLTLIPVDLQMMGFLSVTQCVEADIDTDNVFIKDKDIIYIDGRKFFVIEGTTDLKTRRSTITGLLIPKKYIQ